MSAGMDSEVSVQTATDRAGWGGGGASIEGGFERLGRIAVVASNRVSSIVQARIELSGCDVASSLSDSSPRRFINAAGACSAAASSAN